MCGEKLCPFLAKLVTYDRCVVAANGHIMTRSTYNRCVVEIYVNFEQISHLRYVCSCDKWSYYEKKLTYNRCVVEIHVHFLPN